MQSIDFLYGLNRPTDQGGHTSKKQEHFYQFDPIFPQRPFWAPQLLFYSQAKLYRQTFLCKHAPREVLTGRERDGGMVLRVSLGLFFGKAIPACSCGCPSPALLTFLTFSDISHLFQQIFMPLN